MRIGKTGEKVFSIPIAKDARRRYEAPYIHVHRADLIEMLAARGGDLQACRCG